MKFTLVLLVMIGWLFPGIHAQDTRSTVPDLSGLNLPRAASFLRAAGLQLGEITLTPFDLESAAEVNTISAQTPASGETASAGLRVNVTVLRPLSARLVYDDNDITLINLGAYPLDLNGITFLASPNGASRSFDSSQWADALASGQCGQLWSVNRITSKPVDGCDQIFWISSSELERHFWMANLGAAAFQLLQDGQPRAECETAAVDQLLTCDVLLDLRNPDEFTRYIYLAYTPEVLVVRNQSEDRWMELDDFVVGEIPLTDAEIDRLAPGECLVISASETEQPPEPCRPVALLNASSAFWQRPFQVRGANEVSRGCESTSEGQLNICILSR